MAMKTIKQQLRNAVRHPDFKETIFTVIIIAITVAALLYLEHKDVARFIID